MRQSLLLLVFLVLAPVTFGQTPTAKPAPSASPQPRRDFGSSLKRYKKRQRRDAQDKRKSDDADAEEIIRVRTDLVVNDVLVTNQKGNVILGLRKDDFIITEDGVPQAVATFSFGENVPTPRSVVLIIDSLAPQAAYLKKSIEAAKVLVDKLAPQDKMAIVTVDLRIRSDFTTDVSLLKKTLDSVEKKDVEVWGGWEFSSLLAVLNEMFDEEDRQRIVIFQGDGSQVIWLKPDREHPYPVSHSTLWKSGLKYSRGRDDLPGYGFGDVREAIERSRATIYSVIPGVRFIGLSPKEQLAQARITLAQSNKAFGGRERDLPAIVREYQHAEAESRTAGQTAMFKVAELSGGFADFIETPEDAASVYSNIFTVISNRYLIGYTPTDRQRDGRRREVKVEVRGHPEYTVTGRKAYYLSQ